MKKTTGTNKIFLGIIIAALIIGGSIYFGFRESAQISSNFQIIELNNQLASLQEQVTSLIEEPAVPITATATTTATTSTSVLEEPASEPKPEEPEKDINPCDFLNCDDQDGWFKSGSVYSCQDGNKTCDCQKQIYRNYSCSISKGECVYSTTNTKVDKSNCLEPELKPDLIVQSPAFSPVFPIEKEEVTFRATVKNQGEKSAISSLSYVSIDGQKFTEFSTADLTSNESAVITGSAVWSATVGEHKLEVCADGAKTVAESNEINNCTTITFTVAGKIPDLIIESMDFAPDPLTVGQSVDFAAIVKNQGGASAAPTLTVLRLDVGNDGDWDVFGGSVSTPILEINGNYNAMWRDVWMIIGGTHKFEICADAISEPELRIAESNESNNCLFKIVTVP